MITKIEDYYDPGETNSRVNTILNALPSLSNSYTRDEVADLWSRYSRMSSAMWLIVTEGTTVGFLGWIERRKIELRAETELLAGSKKSNGQR